MLSFLHDKTNIATNCLVYHFLPIYFHCQVILVVKAADIERVSCQIEADFERFYVVSIVVFGHVNLVWMNTKF